MCKKDIKIHFCTCHNKTEEKVKIIHNKNSRRFKKKFNKDEYLQKRLTWSLWKYVKSGYSGIDGMVIMPEEKLTKDITSEFLLKELNNNTKLFDFDYNPNEGDNLIIRSEYINKKIKGRNRLDTYEYLSFIYKKSIWKKDFYNVFYDSTEEIATGIIDFNRH